MAVKEFFDRRENDELAWRSIGEFFHFGTEVADLRDKFDSD